MRSFVNPRNLLNLLGSSHRATHAQMRVDAQMPTHHLDERRFASRRHTAAKQHPNAITPRPVRVGPDENDFTEPAGFA
jgi:hypothetical protein